MPTRPRCIQCDYITLPVSTARTYDNDIIYAENEKQMLLLKKWQLTKVAKYHGTHSG